MSVLKGEMKKYVFFKCCICLARKKSSAWTGLPAECVTSRHKHTYTCIILSLFNTVGLGTRAFPQTLTQTRIHQHTAHMQLHLYYYTCEVFLLTVIIP